MSGGDLHVNEPQLLRNADAANQHAGHLRTWGTAYDNEANYKAWEASTGPMGAPVAAALREHGRVVHQNADQLAGHYDQHAAASRTAVGAYHGTDSAGATLVGATSRMGAGVGQMIPAVMAPLTSVGQAVTTLPQTLSGLIAPATGMIGGAATGGSSMPLANPHDLGPHAHAREALAGSLPPGIGSEQGLQRDTILAKRAISAAFPEITDIGGWRPDALQWHPNGQAIDVMLPKNLVGTPEGKELGDQIVRFALQHSQQFNLNHICWQQTLINPDGSSSPMSDLGNPTANHRDHVHVATNGGGYPSSGDIYHLH